MFGLTNRVLITVINDAAGVAPSVPTFDDVQISALRSIKASRGNVYDGQKVIKEAYHPNEVKKVYQAYGKVGIDFETHAAFSKLDLDTELDRNADVIDGMEILLINRVLLGMLKETLGQASKHRIIPDRIRR